MISIQVSVQHQLPKQQQKQPVVSGIVPSIRIQLASPTPSSPPVQSAEWPNMPPSKEQEELRLLSQRSRAVTPPSSQHKRCLLPSSVGFATATDSNSRPTKRPRLDTTATGTALSSSSNATKKSVRFAAPSALALMIPTTNKTSTTASNDENDGYDADVRWYSRQEYNDFRNDMKLNFFMHSSFLQKQKQDKHKVVIPPPDLCIRGLEKLCVYAHAFMMTPAATPTTMACSSMGGADADLRKVRFVAVLDQQQIQRAVGHSDEDMIRLVAEVLSKRNCDYALARATQDYQEVYSSSS